MTTAYVFPPAAVPSVPVRGRAQRYAVSRIFCVGRNYAAHAREMGSDPSREPPFFFTKPANALLHVPEGATVDLRYPPGTKNLHHEIELVVAIGAPAFQLEPDAAAAVVWGYAAGLDMTRRDLQNAAKDTGRPWDFGKAFEQSAVITDLVPAEAVPLPLAGAVTLAVNGKVRQRGDLGDLIWSVPEVVANLSRYYHLEPGDLIYTGTPEGVGAVVPGDLMTGEVAGVGALSVRVVA
jgi:fumarylpyruvate hydrolase